MNLQAVSEFMASAGPAVFKILLFIGLSFIAHRVVKKISSKFEGRDDLLAQSIQLVKLPSLVVIDSILFITLIKITLGDLQLFIPFSSRSVLKIVTLFSIAWYLYHFISIFEKDLLRSKKEKVDVTAVQTMTKILRLCVLAVLTLTILPAFGFELTGVLTLGAASSLVLGLASKDLLANFFGGLMIYIDKPFGIGDWIKCPEKNIEGTVIDIGWRLTCIRTFERRPLFVPNSFFTQATVENPSRMTNRRIKHFLYLPYKNADIIPDLVEQIRSHIRGSEHIDDKLPCFVHITKLTAVACECMIYCFTYQKDWEKFLDIQQQVMLDIVTILKKNKAAIGFEESQICIQYEK